MTKKNDKNDSMLDKLIEKTINWFIINLLDSILKKIKKWRQKPNIRMIEIPNNQIKIGEIKAYNVIWDILATPNNYYNFLPGQQKFKQITIYKNPKCPKCKEELEERLKRKFILLGKVYYEWFCLNCKFKTKSKKSYWDIAEIIEEYVRKHIKWDIYSAPCNSKQKM